MLANGLGLSAGDLAAFIGAANRERASAHTQPATPQPSLSPQGIRSPCSYPFSSPVRLVGRDQELAMLQQVLTQGRSAGQAVLVAGAAGAGKSALLGELVRRAEDQGVLCLAGAAYQQTGMAPLGPFREALAAYLLERPREDVRMLLGATAADLALLVPELGYYLEFDNPGRDRPGNPQILFAAVHAFLRSLSAHGAVVLCIEDLHDADVASLQLFAYLVRQIAYPTHRLPLVLIGTYRSDHGPPSQELATLAARFRRDHQFKMLSLQPLDRAATSELAEGVLGGPASEPFVDRLHDISAGNPLFAQQLVLASSEEGRLVRTGGVWHERTDRPAHIPPVISELITQRIARLTLECRVMLEVCAVMGPKIDYELLAEVYTGRTGADLQMVLDEAIRFQLLRETPDCYAFTHALVRDAIYSGLTRPRRESVHAQIGHAIEAQAGARIGEHAAALAHHFMLAARTPATREKAVEYGLEAGRRAAALSAHPDALAHFSNVCELLSERANTVDGPRFLEALEGRGRAEREVGRWPESIDTHREILARTADALRRASARAMIAVVHIHMGEVSMALAETAAALGELGDDASIEAAAIRLYVQQLAARIRYFQGNFSELLQLGQEMLVTADATNHTRGQMLAHAVIGWGHMGRGQVPAALDHLQAALVAAEQTGEKLAIATTLETIGLEHYLAGNFGLAEERLERALRLYADSAGEVRAANAVHQRCRVWVATGELHRARERLQRQLDVELVSHDRLAADGHHILGLIDSILSAWTSARDHFEQALAIREHVNDKPGIVETLVEMGLVQQHAGDWRTAGALLRRGVEVADQLEPGPAQVQAHRCLGRFMLLTGDCGRATVELERAMELAQDMSDTLEYAPTLLVMAELHLTKGDVLRALEFGRRGGEHPASLPVDQAIEAQVLLAHLRLAVGDVRGACLLATEAFTRAQRLQAPRLLSVARRATACAAAAAGDWQAAQHDFEAALDYAATAMAPFERALTLKAYAGTHADSNPRRAALQEQADSAIRDCLAASSDLELCTAAATYPVR